MTEKPVRQSLPCSHSSRHGTAVVAGVALSHPHSAPAHNSIGQGRDEHLEEPELDRIVIEGE